MTTRKKSRTESNATKKQTQFMFIYTNTFASRVYSVTFIEALKHLRLMGGFKIGILHVLGVKTQNTNI